MILTNVYLKCGSHPNPAPCTSAGGAASAHKSSTGEVPLGESYPFFPLAQMKLKYLRAKHGISVQSVFLMIPGLTHTVLMNTSQNISRMLLKNVVLMVSRNILMLSWSTTTTTIVTINPLHPLQLHCQSCWTCTCGQIGTQLARHQSFCC